MNNQSEPFNDDNTVFEECECSKEIVESVELTISAPEAGIPVTCNDSSGFDQFPIPEIIPNSDKYHIDRITVNGIERPEAYWKTYNTLVYYSDIRFEAGQSYTVFGKVKAGPGYLFSDPVNLIVNGEEVPSEEVEDYSLEGDSFTFYFDIEAV